MRFVEGENPQSENAYTHASFWLLRQEQEEKDFFYFIVRFIYFAHSTKRPSKVLFEKQGM